MGAKQVKQQNVKIIYPLPQIDIRALQSQRDTIQPTVQVNSIYLNLDQMGDNDPGAKILGLYSLQSVVQDGIDGRSNQLLDLRNRDGRVIPYTENNKNIYYALSGVGF